MPMSFSKVFNELGSVGSTGAYIRDYSFDYISEIPGIVALRWVKEVAPNAILGRKKASEIEDSEVEQEWHGKHFVVVAVEHNKIIAIQKTDYVFYIMQKE